MKNKAPRPTRFKRTAGKYIVYVNNEPNHFGNRHHARVFFRSIKRREK